MDKKVFISYSTEDTDTAELIYEYLEEQGISCWMASKDTLPGEDYPQKIINAIAQCQAIVLLLSEHSNASRYVAKEIERGFSYNKPIFPIRLRDVEPATSLQLFVATSQWIDAWKPPIHQHLDRLASGILAVIESYDKEPHPIKPPKTKSIPKRKKYGFLPYVVAIVAVLGILVFLINPDEPDQQDTPQNISFDAETILNAVSSESSEMPDGKEISRRIETTLDEAYGGIMGRLEIKSKPSGAYILLLNEKLRESGRGVTPFKSQAFGFIPAGAYTLLISSPGYKLFHKEIQVQRGSVIDETFKLEPVENGSDPIPLDLSEIEVNPLDFIEKDITANGSIELGGDFESEWEKDKFSYYAAILDPQSNGNRRRTIQVYFEKSKEGESLYKMLKDADGSVQGEFKIKIPLRLYKPREDHLYAELLEWEFNKD